MRIGKYRVDRRGVRRAFDRRVRGIWRPEFRRRAIKSVLVMTNDSCNLSCLFCTIKGHLPGITSVDSVEDFIQNIEGWRPDHYIQFSGGEVTLLPKKIIEGYVGAALKNNRRTSVLSNAFRPEMLTFFDHVILDDHGVNEEDIKRAVEILRSQDCDFYAVKTYSHFDPSIARKENLSKGVNCPGWISKVTLWRDVVYPCCAMPAVAAWSGFTDILYDKLIDSGWRSSNPYLVETIKNWGSSLPSLVYKLCQLECWRDGKKVWRRLDSARPEEAIT